MPCPGAAAYPKGDNSRGDLRSALDRIWDLLRSRYPYTHLLARADLPVVRLERLSQDLRTQVKRGGEQHLRCLGPDLDRQFLVGKLKSNRIISVSTGGAIRAHTSSWTPQRLENIPLRKRLLIHYLSTVYDSLLRQCCTA